jgi:hypothetical protein
VLELLAELESASAASGAPYDLALAQSTRATVLIHCLSRPCEALPLIDSAERLFSEHCPGTHYERCWLEMLQGFLLEFTGEFHQLAEVVQRREREGIERADGYSMRQLQLSMPTALLAQDRPDAALAFLSKHWRRSDQPFMLFDLIGLVGTSNVLAYSRDARGAYDVLAREWAWLRRSGVFASSVLRETASYFRGRNAVGLYWESREPQLKREVLGLSSQLANVRPIVRPYLALIAASLARAEAQRARCEEQLELAEREFARVGGASGQYCARYRLAQLRGDRARQGAARDWMLQHGVHAPDKWVALSCPGPSDW